MTPLYFGSIFPDYHTPGIRNTHLFSRAWDDENPGPGRPETVRASGCHECIHGAMHWGCTKACPFYEGMMRREAMKELQGVMA